MFNYFIECFLYILPVLLSGILFIFFLKKDYFKFLNKPIDFNKNVFGKNKTFRGIILMPIFCFFFTLILGFFLNNQNEIYLTGNLYKSFFLGLFYSLGELPNSFIKRKLGIPPGEKSKKETERRFFWVLDNIDSIIFCLICLVFIYQINPVYLIGILFLGSIIHFMTDFLMFKIKIKQSL